MKTKAISALTAAFLLLAGAPMNSHIRAMENQQLPAAAKNISLGNGPASITIQPTSTQSLLGKQFVLYKLFDATVSKDGTSIHYTWNDACKEALQNIVGDALQKTPADVTNEEAIDYLQSISENPGQTADQDKILEGSHSKLRIFIDQLKQQLDVSGSKGTEITVSSTEPDGTVVLSGLAYGWYLLDEVNVGTEGAASLCLTTTAAPDAMVQIKAGMPAILKQVYEDDGSIGWNDMADAQTSQTIPYRFEVQIPEQIEVYDKYPLTIQDQFDAALDMDTASVEVTIVDAGGNEYSAAMPAFSCTRQGNEFTIEFDDVKSLIDTLCSPKVNSKGETVYQGYSLQIQFNGVITDALDAYLARQTGLENNVRLLYPNDPENPDSRGETPWDSVVVYTYGIDLSKTDAGGALLAGAGFTLYEDKDCTIPVKMRKLKDGVWIVDSSASSLEMTGSQIQILGLDQGTCYLKETTVPDGYRPLAAPISITINPTFAADRNSYQQGDWAVGKALTDLQASAVIQNFLAGSFLETSENLNVSGYLANLNVVNHTSYLLPATGSSRMLTITAAGIGLAATGVILSQKKKRNKTEG